MHSRRVISLVLGAWLGCGVLVALVATGNFRAVDRLVAAPHGQARAQIATLGQEGARLLLRHQAAETNRTLFETWELAQLPLGVLLLSLLLFGTHESRFALLPAALMLAIVLAQHFALTPRIVEIGRLLDFAPDPQAPLRAQFRVLHGGYSGLEVLKWVMGLGLAAHLVRRHRKPAGIPSPQAC